MPKNTTLVLTILEDPCKEGTNVLCMMQKVGTNLYTPGEIEYTPSRAARERTPESSDPLVWELRGGRTDEGRTPHQGYPANLKQVRNIY